MGNSHEKGRAAMKELTREEERLGREKKALEKHSRMHKLFKENRFAFELERKKELDEFFRGIEDQEKRERLKSLQASWDKKMKTAGSQHNRYVLAQTFFWDHFYNNWMPAMDKLNSLVTSAINEKEKM